MRITKKLLVFLVIISLSFSVFYGKSEARRTVEDAVEWAEDEVGQIDDDQHNQEWSGLCQHFVGHVYGRSNGQFNNAISAWNDTGNTYGEQHTSDTVPDDIPIGALVFFDTSIYADGHVGFYVGNGEMIHAWTDGIRRERVDTYETHYAGWRLPTTWIDNDPRTYCAQISKDIKLCWRTSDAVKISCEQALDWLIHDYKKNQCYPAKKSDCENQCYQKKTSFNQITDFVFTPAYASTPVDSCAYESEGDFDTIVDSDNDGTPDSKDCQPFNNLIFPGQKEICQDGIDNDCSNGDAKCDIDNDGGDDGTTDSKPGHKHSISMDFTTGNFGGDNYKNELSSIKKFA